MQAPAARPYPGYRDFTHLCYVNDQLARRSWVPPINLDAAGVNPEVNHCLLNFLAEFVSHYKQRNRQAEGETVDRAVKLLLSAFDFNQKREYECEPYETELTVRSLIISAFQLLMYSYSERSDIGFYVAAHPFLL
jgi:hypothetical protein